MTSKHYFIRDFSFGNIKDHLYIFNYFMQLHYDVHIRSDVILVSNDDSVLTEEIIDENYSYYLDGLINLSEKEKCLIINKINHTLLENGYTLQIRGNTYFGLDNIDSNTQNQIKRIIAISIFSDQHFDGNTSFNEVINGHNTYKWFHLKNECDVKNSIEANRLYDIIITKDSVIFSNYCYRITFYENDVFYLSIEDKVGDFEPIFRKCIDHNLSTKYTLAIQDWGWERN